jgi:hypothetical protein
MQTQELLCQPRQAQTVSRSLIQSLPCHSVLVTQHVKHVKGLPKACTIKFVQSLSEMLIIGMSSIDNRYRQATSYNITINFPTSMWKVWVSDHHLSISVGMYDLSVLICPILMTWKILRFFKYRSYFTLYGTWNQCLLSFNNFFP